MPLAVRARELKGGVDDVRLLLQLLVHPLHEERVTAGERGNWQNAHTQRALRIAAARSARLRNTAKAQARTSYAMNSRLGSSLPTPLRNRSLNAF